MEHKLKQIINWIRWRVFWLQHIIWIITSIFRNKSSPKNINKILCIEFNFIGDLIATTPAIRALKQKYPKAEIDLLTYEQNVDVLQGNPHLHKIVSSYTPEGYDLLVVFHMGLFWKSFRARKILRDIPFKIGCTNHGMLSSYFPGLNLKVKYKQLQHVVEDNLDVVRLIGIDTQDKSYELYYEEEDILIKRPYIILHPGSKDIHKLTNPSHWWPVENWKQVGRHFSNRYNILITGIEPERFIYESMPEFTDAIGYSINGLKNIIAHASLVISMDSGPVHIASALGVPVISLMGPQDPVIWKPNPGKYIFHDEVCTKCKWLECRYKQPLCMYAITPTEVINLAERLVESEGIRL